MVENVSKINLNIKIKKLGDISTTSSSQFYGNFKCAEYFIVISVEFDQRI